LSEGEIQNWRGGTGKGNCDCLKKDENENENVSVSGLSKCIRDLGMRRGILDMVMLRGREN